MCRTEGLPNYTLRLEFPCLNVPKNSQLQDPKFNGDAANGPFSR